MAYAMRGFPIPTSPGPDAPLIDPFGRGITYLRVSVTDRCDFRCVYCMSEDMAFLPKRDLLTLEELDRICSACGVRRVNVSIDTLDSEKFHRITRWGDLAKVMAGIDAAQAAGLAIKINA